MTKASLNADMRILRKMQRVCSATEFYGSLTHISGVAIYVKDCYVVLVINIVDVPFENTEQRWVVRHWSRCFAIDEVFRPPRYPLNIPLYCLGSSLSAVFSTYYEEIVCVYHGGKYLPRWCLLM